MTDPDGNPATADQPAVINNSWAAPGANDTWFRPMVRRWLELGIVPVFAAGNSGPDTGSVGNPASYPESLAVGAIGEDNVVAPFSGRGPVVWDDEDGTGPAAGTTFIKPDIAAPGVGITSSVGTGYLSYSGTSMAAPHVAGVAALLHQANPALTAAADRGHAEGHRRRPRPRGHGLRLRQRAPRRAEGRPDRRGHDPRHHLLPHARPPRRAPSRCATTWS